MGKAKGKGIQIKVVDKYDGNNHDFNDLSNNTDSKNKNTKDPKAINNKVSYSVGIGGLGMGSASSISSNGHIGSNGTNGSKSSNVEKSDTEKFVENN